MLFQKHVDQLTGISVELIPEKSLLLPSLTFCFEEPFKSRGYHYKEEDFVKNTFQLSDIFGPKSLEDFKNPNVKVKEVRSEQFGLCYSVTSIKNQTLLIELTRNKNVKVFILNVFKDTSHEDALLDINTALVFFFFFLLYFIDSL